MLSRMLGCRGATKSQVMAMVESRLRRFWGVHPQPLMVWGGLCPGSEGLDTPSPARDGFGVSPLPSVCAVEDVGVWGDGSKGVWGSVPSPRWFEVSLGVQEVRAQSLGVWGVHAQHDGFGVSLAVLFTL